jgi:hypothetical protein
MKNLLQFLLTLILGFAALNLFGWLFCTGESYPPPKYDNVLVYTVRVPASSPISP